MSDNPEKTEQSPAVAAPEETAAPEGAEEQGAVATVERTSPCECVIHIEATAEYLQKKYREELDSVQGEVACRASAGAGPPPRWWSAAWARRSATTS